MCSKEYAFEDATGCVWKGLIIVVFCAFLKSFIFFLCYKLIFLIYFYILILKIIFTKYYFNRGKNIFKIEMDLN